MASASTAPVTAVGLKPMSECSLRGCDNRFVRECYLRGIVEAVYWEYPAVPRTREQAIACHDPLARADDLGR